MIDLAAGLMFGLERGSQHLFAELPALLLMLGWNALPDLVTREGEAVLL